jgi:hypothetical protein
MDHAQTSFNVDISSIHHAVRVEADTPYPLDAGERQMPFACILN